MNRTRKKTAPGGCSGLGLLIFFALAVGAIAGWPMYLDANGTSAPGVITEKQEGVRIRYGDWFRRFQVIAAYSVPGHPLQHRAICDVDEKTYDSLHLGNRVEVHYFTNLLNQPFVPATHLSPCSTLASISWNPILIHRVEIALAPLVVILFLWRVLRLRIAAFLLLPWLCFSFAYVALPRVEPEPQYPVQATATVASVTTITTLGRENRKSLRLPHPYQIVRLQFVPPGMDSAVTAIDKVDVGSVPNLKEGESANIVYDSERPRIARLQAGSRLFPGQALMTVIYLCVALGLLLAITSAIGGFFHLIGRNRLVQFVRANAALRRRYRR